jgi:hypothetical protein
MKSVLDEKDVFLTLMVESNLHNVVQISCKISRINYNDRIARHLRYDAHVNQRFIEISVKEFDYVSRKSHRSERILNEEF